MENVINNLVVVHVDTLDATREQEKKLIQNIYRQALSALLQNKRVFILSTLYPFDLGKDFSLLRDKCVTIPFPTTTELGRLSSGVSLGDAQFVALKLALVESGIDEVDISGVARSICVRNVDHLLRGASLRDVHPSMAELLKIEDARLRNALRVSINAHVLEDLCLD